MLGSVLHSCVQAACLRCCVVLLCVVLHSEVFHGRAAFDEAWERLECRGDVMQMRERCDNGEITRPCPYFGMVSFI